eukprot:g4280.t1
MLVDFPPDPAFTVTDAIFGEDGAVDYHFMLAHVVAFPAPTCGPPIAADDADDAAWYSIATGCEDSDGAPMFVRSAAGGTVAEPLVPSVPAVVKKAVRAARAGLLGDLEFMSD